jgi:hypothetical protein
MKGSAVGHYRSVFTALSLSWGIKTPRGSKTTETDIAGPISIRFSSREGDARLTLVLGMDCRPGLIRESEKRRISFNEEGREKWATDFRSGELLPGKKWPLRLADIRQSFCGTLFRTQRDGRRRRTFA